LLDQVILEFRKNARTNKSEIAATARQFMKSPAMTRANCRDMDRNQQLAGFNRRLEQIEEEVIGGYAAGSIGIRDLKLGTHRERHRGKFGRRVRMRNAATEGALVTDRGMRHMRRSLAEKRRMLGNERIGHHLAMSRQRADPQPFALKLDAAKRFNMCDVNQDFGSLQTQRERRHKALAARNIARVLARIRERLKRLSDRYRPCVAECARLQSPTPDRFNPPQIFNHLVLNLDHAELVASNEKDHLVTFCE